MATQTGSATSYISELTVKYCNKGITAITENHYGGNHGNMSLEEKAALLKLFLESAEVDQIVEVNKLLRAYEERLGRTFEEDHGQIYRVLERHGWRKVMPRNKHSNKASDEVIEVSKKLTL